MYLENNKNKIFINNEELKVILNKYTAKFLYSSTEYDLFMIEPSGNIRINFDKIWISICNLGKSTFFPYNLIISKEDLKEYIEKYLS